MFDFQEGEILLVDKPLEWTSFQVVNKIRYAIRRKLGVKKIKVGHAGTLDPLATGLLILCTGRKTKTIEQIQMLKKEYTGIIQLGATTPSYDLETEIDQEFATDHLTQPIVEEAARKLTGELDQVPPIFSAKKVNGKRAYQAARKGEHVELKPKQISVFEFETKLLEGAGVEFKIQCSKGTYIRSLARDLGRELNNGGHLTALRRTKIGQYSVQDALSPDQLVQIIEKSELI